MQRTWGSKISETVSRRRGNLALRRVYAASGQPFGYYFYTIRRNGYQQRFLSVYQCEGVCPGPLGSTDDLFGVALGICSLGNPPRVGRAPLPSVFRVDAGRRRAGVYTQESRGTGGLLFALCRGLLFCLQIRQRRMSLLPPSGN